MLGARTTPEVREEQPTHYRSPVINRQRWSAPLVSSGLRRVMISEVRHDEILFGRRHLGHVLREDFAHYKRAGPTAASAADA
jgi:hypothetical protein